MFSAVEFEVVVDHRTGIDVIIAIALGDVVEQDFGHDIHRLGLFNGHLQRFVVLDFLGEHSAGHIIEHQRGVFGDDGTQPHDGVGHRLVVLCRDGVVVEI